MAQQLSVCSRVGVEAVPSEPSASPRFYGIRTRRTPPTAADYRKQNSSSSTTTGTTTTFGMLLKSSSDESLFVSGRDKKHVCQDAPDNISNNTTATTRRSETADAITTRTNHQGSDNNSTTTTRTNTCSEQDGMTTGGYVLDNNSSIIATTEQQTNKSEHNNKRKEQQDNYDLPIVRQDVINGPQQQQIKQQGNVCVGGLRGHICPPIAMEQTMWEVLEPYGCQQCLDSIKASGCDTTVHIGLWSDKAISCGMPLPTGLSFIDEFVAKKFTPLQLLTVRDKYLTELKARFPIWLNTLETDEGWKYHGTKNGNVFHRREPKGEPPIIRGRLNMGSALTLQDYNDINMDRDFYYNLYKDSKSLKHFKPAVTWAGSLEQPWFLNLSWLCYNGFPPIVSDREVLTASLVVFLDKHTTVTVSMSVDDFTIEFPERPKTSIPVQLGAIFRTRQFADKTVEHCGVVQASMKLLVPQCIFIRSSLFTQPVDWPLVMQYAQSARGRAAIGKHPVCSLINKVADGIDSRSMWLEGKVNNNNNSSSRLLKSTDVTIIQQQNNNKDTTTTSSDVIVRDGCVCRSVSTNSGGDVTESEEDEHRLRYNNNIIDRTNKKEQDNKKDNNEESDQESSNKQQQDVNKEETAFDPWLELQSVTAETLCEYAWQKKLIDVGGSGYGCVSGQQ
eukprot:GHVS01089909.1.p1 GENE.GHVS01089909.1~~GHVS01089909.1.p1  ORF type:complete len:673 (+),score=147.28 GHVS01089909.1:776-2794(+)